MRERNRSDLSHISIRPKTSGWEVSVYAERRGGENQFPAVEFAVETIDGVGELIRDIAAGKEPVEWCDEEDAL